MVSAAALRRAALKCSLAGNCSTDRASSSTAAWARRTAQSCVCTVGSGYVLWSNGECMRFQCNPLIQSNMLYTFDPKAMHHIVIKDQDIFEEPTWFTR